MSFISGLILGLSLIVAIGAQNIWVLGQSMAGANRLVIATVCIVCDASLIVFGVYSAQELQQWIPEFIPWFTWGGIALLLYLAYDSAKRAFKGSSGMILDEAVTVDWKKTALTALAISLLNPHVYLDTVILLGSVGALQPSPTLFAVGACIASVTWFGSLVLFSPKLKRLLSSPKRWRIFDSAISILLCLVAVQLYSYA